MNLKHKKIMDVVYKGEDLDKISNILYAAQIPLETFIQELKEELGLSYKQAQLLQYRSICIADKVIQLVYDNKDKEDMYSHIKTDESLYEGELRC